MLFSTADFWVLVSFIVFLSLLLKYKVFRTVAALIDKRTDSVISKLEEARLLREEAAAVLASLERKISEFDDQSDKVLEDAKSKAVASFENAKKEADKEIDLIVFSASRRMSMEIKSLMSEFHLRVARVSVDAVSILVEERISDSLQDKIVDSVISDLENKLGVSA